MIAIHMAKPEEKRRAIELRRKGMSVKEIGRAIKIAPSTVSLWLRDIELTPEQKEVLHAKQIVAGHRGRMIGAEMNRMKRSNRLKVAQEEAINILPDLTDRELFLIGIGLYWGEGVKSNSGSLALINSDPRVIQLMSRWFMECLEVEKSRFMPRIFISDTHRDRETDILRFWSKALDIPISQFRRTTFLDRGKKIYENRDVYYGVLALRVSKGTDIRDKILAYIERIAQIENCRRSSVG